jgi:hypothetical protein
MSIGIVEELVLPSPNPVPVPDEYPQHRTEEFSRVTHEMDPAETDVTFTLEFRLT